MKNEEYKKLSISEFTKAAGRYESNHAGIYEMCKKDYPDILAELEKLSAEEDDKYYGEYLTQKKKQIIYGVFSKMGIV